MPAFTNVDIALLCVLLFSTALGALRGLLFEVLSLLVWVVAFLAAQWFSPQAMLLIFHKQPPGNELYYGATFVLVFIVTAFVSGIVVARVKSVTDSSGMHSVDRALGAVFGLARGAMILMSVSVILRLTANDQHAFWKDSLVPPWITLALVKLKPFFPDSFNAYLG